MDRKLLVAAIVAAACVTTWCVVVVALIVWPTPWLFAVAMVVAVVGAVPVGWLALHAVRLVVKGVRRILEVEKEVNALARTVGRSAPVLRRIDDRGRALIHDRPWDRALSGTQRDDTFNAAVVVSSKAEAFDTISGFRAHPSVCDRLVLVLDPRRRGRWGTWIDDPLADGVTVVAGEHLAAGSVDVERLFTSRLVLCVTAGENGPLTQAISRIVSPDEVAVTLGLKQAGRS